MFARLSLSCTRTLNSTTPIFRVVSQNPVLRLETPKSRFSTTSRAMAAFERLIRFQAEDGKTVYGNLEKEVPTREIEGSQVEVLEGDVKSGFKKSGAKAKVSKLLSPLETTNIVLCVGLNYRRHAEESNVCCCLFLGNLELRSHANILFVAPNTRKPSHIHEAQ